MAMEHHGLQVATPDRAREVIRVGDTQVADVR
jgi:hypothetical protein